ncbi:secreted RxLR effector protein 161-like [Amaranthus tricolor]|uniref:secreted RxLR effector protein 161-like n=1 Tax=Amaranthus tricolor TaxID=29722 RepID=UPI00258722B1|nr:secreted RxLR effector protein 161-like [Amaranthus tricolor]
MVINEKLLKYDGKPKVDKATYRCSVDSLIYLTHTRPDIVNAVSIVSRFMSKPSKDHLIATKRILRYIKKTKSYGIMYETKKDFKLTEYTDNDWAGSLDDRKTQAGTYFNLEPRWSHGHQKSRQRQLYHQQKHSTLQPQVQHVKHSGLEGY